MSMEQKFVNVYEGKQALETIKHWVRNNEQYPEYYHSFFTKWSLINPLYNACSNKKNKEPKKVVDFGKKNNDLWSKSIEENTKTLVSFECVGDGKNDAPPNEYVKAATLHLRTGLQIDSNDVCPTCRKKDRCKDLNESIYSFNKFGATLRILYQIRCNLFHGDKPELVGYQGERNKKLVSIGDKILTEVLECLAKV